MSYEIVSIVSHGSFCGTFEYALQLQCPQKFGTCVLVIGNLLRTIVTMSAMVSKIASASIVCSNVCSNADQRKHQSSPSMTLASRIHRSPMNSPHKGPVTRKIFPFDDAIMYDTNDKLYHQRIWKSIIKDCSRRVSIVYSGKDIVFVINSSR